jgi:hypothetical protein
MMMDAEASTPSGNATTLDAQHRGPVSLTALAGDSAVRKRSLDGTAQGSEQRAATQTTTAFANVAALEKEGDKRSRLCAAYPLAYEMSLPVSMIGEPLPVQEGLSPQTDAATQIALYEIAELERVQENWHATLSMKRMAFRMGQRSPDGGVAWGPWCLTVLYPGPHRGRTCVTRDLSQSARWLHKQPREALDGAQRPRPPLPRIYFAVGPGVQVEHLSWLYVRKACTDQPGLFVASNGNHLQFARLSPAPDFDDPYATKQDAM